MMPFVQVAIFLTLVTLSVQQPPGVPPRQQNQPPQGQQQQYQQQQQQQQYQQQQQQQQQYQQQQHQQQPGGHGHGHGEHGKPLEFASEVHNAEHILEHLEKVVATKPKEQMTEEELEFHYFKLHDYDNNNKLDGVEIGKALTHFHEEEGSHLRQLSEEELTEVIDAALESDDLNDDGYVEYPELMTAKARARVEREKLQEQGKPPGFQQQEPGPPGDINLNNEIKPPGF